MHGELPVHNGFSTNTEATGKKLFTLICISALTNHRANGFLATFYATTN